MSFDPYKNKLKHAAWTWRESKVLSFFKSPRNKDRESGRNDKRAARAEVRREIESERE